MVARLLVLLVRLYQLTLSRLIRAVFGPVCRFEPSCSRYAVACLQNHGALRGALLSARRLGKCHPFHPGGYDPPPPPRTSRAPSPSAQEALPPSGARADPPPSLVDGPSTAAREVEPPR